MNVQKEYAIRQLTPDLQKRIRRNPLLNIDAFIIPSPYVKDTNITEDYSHSYVWIEEGEILGYILVYSDEQRKNFHIYKVVTSPFGRGRGIGRTFIEHLAEHIPTDAQVYLYLWEKQPDTLEFFKRKGFTMGEQIVYRNRIYYLLSATAKKILASRDTGTPDSQVLSEDIGKARHDARKTMRMISHMVESLSMENSGRIIEDINRETTTLINILNEFRDTMDQIHEVNLKDLIVERIIPYIEASSVPCTLVLSMDVQSSIVLGYYVNFGRALINIVSNSLDSIQETGRKGRLEISLEDVEDQVRLTIRDSGTGIPKPQLKVDAKGVPLFVGKSTKDRKDGEGLGTIQIFSAFGTDRIQIESEYGKGTAWSITFDKATGMDKWYAQLERRFYEFSDLLEPTAITASTKRTEVISYIWQLRKMEIFLFDLILQFSHDHNIRTIYRTLLAYSMGRLEKGALKKEIGGYRCQQSRMRTWMYNITVELKARWDQLKKGVDLGEYRGPLFRSYGQALDNVIIFTMDPESGNFLATDRKLAEHLDFVPYLEKGRNELVRGELMGDINKEEQPITLGVWSVSSDEDLLDKLKLLRTCAYALVNKGVRQEKRLAFYQTTYSHHSRDIDPDKVTTFGKFMHTPDASLMKYTRSTDDYLRDYIQIVD